MSTLLLSSENELYAQVPTLAGRLTAGSVVYLHGPLGAGKTALARALLRHWGESGPVRSPTYPLLNSYPLANFTVHHFDLYRITDPEELELAGFRECFTPHALCLIEWPEHGIGWLPAADWHIHLDHHPQGRSLKLRSANEA